MKTIIDTDKILKKKKKSRLSWFFLAIFLFIFFNAFSIVQEGHVGISKRLGKARTLLNSGFHPKIPFIDTVMQLETRTQLINISSQAVNKDQIEVKLTLSANWHLPPDSVGSFYQKYGTIKQYKERVLTPLLNAVSHGLISLYTTAELLEKRSEITHMITTSVKKNTQLSLIKFEKVKIEQITLPKAYQAGLEEKLIQQQILQSERLKADKEILKAKTDFDIAEIKAKASIKIAKAKAEAISIHGNAKASVIKKIINAMQESHTYVQYEKIQKWDGKLSNTVANPNDVFKSIEK